MRYRVLWVGKKSRDALVMAADDYAERLSHYVPLEVVRLNDGTQAAERDAIVRQLNADTLFVALDEHGTQHTTVGLSERLAAWSRSGRRSATLVVGGADGLHPDLLARANETWALSRFTLPHRLALVVLLEQLYRAHSYLRGEPYHRA